MKHRLLSAALVLGVLTSLLSAASAVEPRDSEGGSRAEESAKANALFDKFFDQKVDRSPMLQGYLGIKRDRDKWDDFSEEARLAELGHTVADLAELKTVIHQEQLDDQTKLSYRLFVEQAELEIEGWKWRDHGYTFTQLGGMHTDAPAYLINFHAVDTVADAEAYIARLRALPAMFGQQAARAEAQAARGILPPRFVFPMMIESCRDVISGAPFDDKPAKSALWEDFSAKVGALPDADDKTKARLLAEARAALLEAVQPAYQRLITLFQAQERIATDDDGVWKLPEGRDYYNYRLRTQTTTTLPAETIHETGLREVARIHADMEAVKAKLGFKGDLRAFLAFMRDDPQWSYPSTDEGRAAYMKRANEVIDTMRARLPEFFTVFPKAQLVVKRVEPFREKGAPAAFYEQPAPDGSRPGYYYVNTLDMRALAIWEMETLAHHEAIPGHHMQIAIAQELERMPKFRKFGGFVAYDEGWALYAEYFPKEFGFYQDPAQDFGRLSDELLRAIRLVVDTGIHAKHWTRQQVVDYFRANAASSETEIASETNRYIVWPGQACGYKIGMLRILELRELARKELGPKFDLRAYHDLVLQNGALPLDLLEENVHAWIARRKA